MEQSKRYNQGWDGAYKEHDGNSLEQAYLWNEEAIPFLQESKVIQKLRRNGVQTVLDAGCGDGRNSFHLEERGFFITGVDISQTALEIASERAVREARNRVVFMEGDICNLKVNGPFDCVICCDALGQVPDPAKAVAEFWKVLHPGGILIANLYTPEDSTCGVGTEIAPLQYEYKGTLFRYFKRLDVEDIFKEQWKRFEIRQTSWYDPPHGDYRPEPHQHVSWIVTAIKA